MGRVLSPKMPGEDPEARRLKEEERERQAMERQAIKEKEGQRKRKVAANMIGTRSLQDAGMEGYTGFRKMMGKTKGY